MTINGVELSAGVLAIPCMCSKVSREHLKENQIINQMGTDLLCSTHKKNNTVSFQNIQVDQNVYVLRH